MDTIIVWFRQDLRLSDNPALFEAVKQGQVLPVYILDDNKQLRSMGAASRVWLHHALHQLNKALDNKLNIFKGNAEKILLQLAKKISAKAVYWNRCYEPWRIAQDKAIETKLEKQGIEVYHFNGSLLWEPWESVKDNGEPYKVFTPFYKKAVESLTPREPLKAPERLQLSNPVASDNINSLGLLPKVSWDKPLIKQWDICEEAAQNTLYTFLKKTINHYEEGRDFPARSHISRLAPYLHFGHTSPHQIWHAARFEEINHSIECFCKELGWREFSYHLLYHFPDLPSENFQQKFDAFPWEDNAEWLGKWQQGKTGYPIVDAGMRELWQTGYMHNRVRMIVGSFLVKNLRIHWREGEAWFWDCLLDADLANNTANWQWIAGCGADAAPYFRIFNPVTQGERFDAEGEYTKRFVPELRNLPKKYLFKPWDAPAEVLKKAGVTLGADYPKPIVDLKTSRDAAMAAYQSLNRCQ